MKKTELVIIPAPGIGHLVSTIEFAKRLTLQDDRFSVTVLVMKMPLSPAVAAYIQSLASSVTGVRFLDLPQVDPPSTDLLKSPESYISVFIENHKPHVKDTIINSILASESNPPRLAGLVLDLFCTTMIDVANELGVPSYLFFTSSAAFLGLMLHLPILDGQIATEFGDSETDLTLPSFTNPVPPRVLPTVVLNRKADGYAWYLYHGRRFRETKGIIVNTFPELEPHALNSLVDDHHNQTPRLFPVGPLIDLKGRIDSGSNPVDQENIMRWLDDQPPSSVIFLCFGSMGSFSAPQVREIAIGLEQSGYRFLWSLRQPPTPRSRMPSNYTNLEEVLPEGFLERTIGKGLVCGWVPQVSVLAHQSIGGFVSHCGWNSILESLWYDVPIVSWPMYAEQQINAFEMVKELGLAVELRMDYRINGGDLVMAEEVERGVKSVMDCDGEVRRKVKEMGEKSRKAVMDGESSFNVLEQLIDELMIGSIVG